MAEQTPAIDTPVRPLDVLLKEVEQAILEARKEEGWSTSRIKDLRWQFDQTSAKMNQAVYNDEREHIHQSCLRTIAILMEILART